MKGSNFANQFFELKMNIMIIHKQLFSILLAGVLLLSGSALMAQQGPPEHHRPFHKDRPMFLFDDLMEMQGELQLTEEQMNRLNELKADFEKARQQYRQFHREAFHNREWEYKTSLIEVLTEEQLAKIRAVIEERRARHKERMKKVDREGLHQEMKAYHEANIRPVMLQQRAKLEEKISPEDKALLAELRPKFEANRREMEQLRQGPNHSREDFKALREENKEEHEALKGLVEKYSEDIDALLAEIKDQQEQWHKDMRAIHEKYAPAPEEGQGRKRGGERGKGEQKMHRPGGHPHPGMHPEGREMRKGHFLLLDPNAPAEMPAEATATSNVKVYPNPAANQVTLEYTLLRAGNVRIELRDKEGNLVKVVEEGQKANGDYRLPVDATALQDGVYYLTIISQGEKTAQKVVVAKQ